MEVKRFTGEEMDALRQNPYTYKVTQCHLSFTAEFKELFWKHYNEGMTPKDILVSLGYDPEVLGENRVNGIMKGQDLIGAGVRPGKELGRILQELLELVLECPERNERGGLLEEAKRLRTAHDL